MTVDIGGRRVELPSWYLQTPARGPGVQHAYAIPGHIAQGMTVDHAFVLGSPEIYREWGYTAMSRGRHSNRLYVMAPDDLERSEVAPRQQEPPTAMESLMRGLATSRAQTAALDEAQLRRIRNAPTHELQRRLAQRRAVLEDRGLAAAVRDYEDLTRWLDATSADVAATRQHLASLGQHRPSPLQLRARRSHQLKEQQLEEGLSQRLETLTAATAEVERASHELASRRAAHAQGSSDDAAEIELIRDELRRRTALERVAELKAPKERLLTLDDRVPRASLEP